MKRTSYEAPNYSVFSSIKPPPPTLLGQNILLSTLFSYTTNPCSSLSVTDQVSHPHKITSKIQFCIF